MSEGLPDRASVVIIGGGVIGCSIAAHLVAAGVRDLVLLEAGELGAGSTCKAAGGVRASFSAAVNIEMGLRGLDVYSRFSELYGQEIDFRRSGYLYCLSTPELVEAFTEMVGLQNCSGVPSKIVSPEKAQELSPVVSTEGMLAAAWSPHDGLATPESVVLGYAGAARRGGASLITGCVVHELLIDGGAVAAVRTERGTIRTSTVVCAAGAWSRCIAATAGVDLPVTPYRRQIALTEAIPDLPPILPMTIDLPSTVYCHREGRGLLFGWSDPLEPPGFSVSFELGSWFERLAENAVIRLPRLLEVGITTGWAGLYEVTPDNNQIIGRSAEVDGILYATGFSGHGFLMAPATGEIVRDLILDREPTYAVADLDVRRFTEQAAGCREQNII